MAMGQDGWRFYDFVNGAGENQIAEWMRAQGHDLRARMDALIRNLGILDRAFTRDDSVGLLRKPPCKGEQLIELIIKLNKVQYRPIGWYGPGPREVTLLIGAIEKGDHFEPRNAAHIAIQRKQLVQSNRRYIRDHAE